MSMWSAFALWAATVWDRMPRGLRMAGAGTIVVCGLAIGGITLYSSRIAGGGTHWGSIEARFSAWRVLQEIPIGSWQTLQPMGLIAAGALVIFAGIAVYLSATERPKLAATMLGLAMVPTGLSMIDGVARMSPYFSLANAARFFNARPADRGEVIYEGSLHQGSSLVFYLRRRFFIVNRPADDDSFLGPHPSRVALDEKDVLEKWGEPATAFLIIDQHRVSYWQKLLTDRFHIYHQVTTCGTYVVLSNQL